MAGVESHAVAKLGRGAVERPQAYAKVAEALHEHVPDRVEAAGHVAEQLGVAHHVGVDLLVFAIVLAEHALAQEQVRDPAGAIIHGSARPAVRGTQQEGWRVPT